MTRPSRENRPTAAQMRVILANDGHLLVGAGAGSGKTSTVVQKLCYLLGAPITDSNGVEHRCATPIGLHQIAAITYTNQAAADLKRKLRAGLRVSGLRQEATDVDTARIGTIHGFCGDILRDFSLRAGMAPSQRILGDGESASVMADAARAALHSAAEREMPGLASLLSGRKLGSVLACLVRLASDTTQLALWEANAAMLREHECTLLKLARNVTTLRDQELDRLGALDFDRMITATRDLLRDDASVRHAVQRTMSLLVVDEFQDVDPAQRDIAMCLGGMGYTDPKPARVMFVGDPKQSIYRFRRADVSLWNDVQRRFAVNGAGTVLQLSDNFRSKRGILALVDDLVGSRIDRPVHDDGNRRAFEVDYAKLDACGEHADGDECVELLLVPAGDDGKPRKAEEVRLLEASGIAARIAALVNDGAKYGDIALLLGGWGALGTYEQALRDAGIPTYALRSQGFQEAREVLDCVLALRAIRDQRDDVAVVGFLKGPFVGVRDDTLVALAQAKHAGGVAAAMGSEAREASLLEWARGILTRFGALRDRIPVHELLMRLVEESGFLVSLSLDTERGLQAVANIRKLIRMARNAPEISLGEFLRDFTDLRLREDRIGEERLYRERADVITITSVHSAKGLEWPVVFWCDLVRTPPVEKDELLCGRDTFRLRTVKELDGSGKEIPDPEHDALKADLQLERNAESYRLWYVASTRPQQLLVLSGIPLGAVKNEPASVAGLVRTRFASELLGPVLPERITYRHEDETRYQLVVRLAPSSLPEPTAVSGASADVDICVPPEHVDAVTGRTRLSATQLTVFRRDPSRWWQQYVFGFDPSAVAAPSSTGANRAETGPHGGMRTGSVAHAVLERHNYELADIAELIEAAIAEHDGDAPDASTSDGAVYRTRIRELVERAANHPEWKAVAAEPSARHELAFTRILAGGGTIEGSLDLAAVTTDGVRILDAKTGGSHDHAALARRYAVQGATYTEAVGAITGRPATFALLLAVSGETVEVPADASISADEIVGRLREHRP